jgi:hypothetical protein
VLPSEASRFLLASAQRQLLASLDKDETLTISGSTPCNVGGDEAPCLPECLEHEAETLRSSGAFFDRHHVEAGNDLGYAAQVEEIPSGRVVLLRSPLLSSPADARRFQVAMRRLRSRCRGGIASSSAETSL